MDLLGTLAAAAPAANGKLQLLGVSELGDLGPFPPVSTVFPPCFHRVSTRFQMKLTKTAGPLDPLGSALASEMFSSIEGPSPDPLQKMLSTLLKEPFEKLAPLRDGD